MQEELAEQHVWKKEFERLESSLQATPTAADTAALTRKLAVLTINEDKLKRRFSLLSTSEAELKKQVEQQRTFLHEAEAISRTRIVYLESCIQQQEAKLREQASQIDASVHRDELTTATQRSEVVAAKYRQLLLRYMRLKQARGELHHAMSDRIELKHQLELYQKETQVQQQHIKELENQLSQRSLPEETLQERHRIASSQLFYHKQRAEAYEMQLAQANSLLQSTRAALRQSQERVEALENELLDSQTRENKMQDEIAELAPRAQLEAARVESNQLRDKLAEVEQSLLRMTQQKEIAFEQADAVHRLHHARDEEIRVLRQQQLELQTTDDAMATVGRLQRRMLSMQV